MQSITTKSEPLIYAGRIKDRDILMRSSSGGAFTALSDIFLEHGDIVIATVYNYQSHIAEFCLLRTKAERDAACGSKYMQSKVGNTFKMAEMWLRGNPDKKLLFVGMGCQAEGFRKYAELKGIRDRVYIVDIICHGSSSPKLWKEYAKLLEKKNNGVIRFLSFKDKRNGWKSPTAFVVIQNREISIKDYVKVFYNRCALRPSCHVCSYATIKRKTDITIGDFWHIEKTIPKFYDPQGNSLFLIHTELGEELFEHIKKRIDYQRSNVKQCWQTNLESPTPISERRDKFWEDYQAKGIDFIMKKYGQDTLRNRIKKLIRLSRNESSE